MHITKALPDSIILMHEYSKWIQSLDYEQVPFRCCKCHEHGHLYKDCPLNQYHSNLKPTVEKDEEGFQKYEREKRHTHKHPPMEKKEDHLTTSNSFKILEDLLEDPKELETEEGGNLDLK